tara:strand:- start:598 stop:876 length:279 start_codon:yes stop_codon:yes gene_type:complete
MGNSVYTINNSNSEVYKMSKVNILRDIRDYLIENSNFAVDYDDIAEIDSWVEVLNELIGQTEWFETNLQKINDSMDELIDFEIVNVEEEDNS